MYAAVASDVVLTTLFHLTRLLTSRRRLPRPSKKSSAPPIVCDQRGLQSSPQRSTPRISWCKNEEYSCAATYRPTFENNSALPSFICGKVRIKERLLKCASTPWVSRCRPLRQCEILLVHEVGLSVFYPYGNHFVETFCMQFYLRSSCNLKLEREQYKNISYKYFCHYFYMSEFLFTVSFTPSFFLKIAITTSDRVCWYTEVQA